MEKHHSDNESKPFYSFGQIVHRYCREMGYKLSEAYEILKQKDVHISKTSFYDYAKGTAVPSYEKARSILLGLNINIKDAETLTKILQDSRNSEEYLAMSGYQLHNLYGTYSIPWVQLYDEVYSAQDARARFDKRRNECAKNATDYIVRLIRYDIKHHILPSLNQEERKEEEHE